MGGKEAEIALDPQRHEQPAEGVKRQRECRHKAVEMLFAVDERGRREHRDDALQQAAEVCQRDAGVAVSAEAGKRSETVCHIAACDDAHPDGEKQVDAAQKDRAARADAVAGVVVHAADHDQQHQQGHGDQREHHGVDRGVLDVLLDLAQYILFILAAVIVGGGIGFLVVL